jgi:hypothetical protein
VIVALSRTSETGLVYASASIYWAAGMAASAGWTPWMARVVPARIRGKFFGRRQGLLQAAMLFGLVGAGAALHVVSGTTHVLDVYAGMFGLAMLARLGSALVLARMGRDVDPAPTSRMQLRHVGSKLRGNPRAPLLVYLIAALAAAAISGPFNTPYLLDHHHLDYAQYCVFTTTIIVVKIAVSPLVGRVLQRRGVRPVLSAAAVGIATVPLFWLVSDSFAWFVCMQIYAGFAWAALELGMLMVLFDADSDAERTTMQVAFSAAQSLGNVAGSLIGGVILDARGTDHQAYMTLFVVSALGRLAAAMLIVRRLRRVPRILARLPFGVAAAAWTLAIRPWGATIVRPIVDGIVRFRRP